MITLGIGIPAYRGIIASQQAKMWLQVGACVNRPEMKKEIEIGMIADIDMCGIDNARNALLYVARQAKTVDANNGRGLDWLLMIDSDTWVEKGSDLIQMILEAESLGAAIVGAPVKMRGVQSPINIYKYEEQHRIEGAAVVVRVKPIAETELVANKPIIDIDGVGGAVIAVNLHRVKDASFDFVKRNGVNISEDLEFCRQVKSIGGKIYADLRITTHHVNKPDILTYYGR